MIKTFYPFLNNGWTVTNIVIDMNKIDHYSVWLKDSYKAVFWHGIKGKPFLINITEIKDAE